MHVDVLVVGSGLAGCVVAERLARVGGRRVLVVEQRPHVGGNCHDAWDDHGILVHRYGPHIFHTASEAVWTYLNRFTAFNGYQHRVLGVVDGKRVPIPFNLDSLDALFPPPLARRIEARLLATFGFGARVPMRNLRATDDPELRLLAGFVYEKVFAGYTRKQWGLRLEDLSPEAADRVPVRVSRDDRYFQDPYQGIPVHGYHRLFENLLSHPKIHVLLNTPFEAVKDGMRWDRLVYTGALDAFFDFRFGPLPYRTLDFAWERVDRPWFQETAQVNFPNDHAFTRITEHKHFGGQVAPWTTISREYARAAEPGRDVPFYPLATAEARAAWQRYADLADERPDVVFLGRLAEYRYHDMDDTVERALAVAAGLLEETR